MTRKSCHWSKALFSHLIINYPFFTSLIINNVLLTLRPTSHHLFHHITCDPFEEIQDGFWHGATFQHQSKPLPQPTSEARMSDIIKLCLSSKLKCSRLTVELLFPVLLIPKARSCKIIFICNMVFSLRDMMKLGRINKEITSQRICLVCYMGLFTTQISSVCKEGKASRVT